MFQRVVPNGAPCERLQVNFNVENRIFESTSYYYGRSEGGKLYSRSAVINTHTAVINNNNNNTQSDLINPSRGPLTEVRLEEMLVERVFLVSGVVKTVF